MTKNRTVWIVGGVLVLVILVAALVAGGGKKKSKPPTASPPVSARAVALPANRSRTVVIPPCNTPVRSTARNAAAGRSTPGATTARLPRSRGGVHTLLVPNCQESKSGATNAAGDIPSAAFILGDRKRLTKDSDGKLISDGVAAGSQLLLPDGSNTATIVVPPCIKKTAANDRDVVLKGDSDLAVGPTC